MGRELGQPRVTPTTAQQAFAAPSPLLAARHGLRGGVLAGIWTIRSPSSGQTPYLQGVNTAQEIIDFVRNRMRMSHVYQPLLVRALVRAGGSATLRQLATSLLVEDESQLLYYEERIKKMPLPVLRGHDIVTSDRDLISLNVGRLTYEDRAEIEAACTQKLAEFLQRRGLATWDYRMLESDPVRADVRYRVLARARGRCQLCGATSGERRIEVDHIVPRSRGGTNDMQNLQALCDECNRGKSNADDTDFRVPPLERTSDGGPRSRTPADPGVSIPRRTSVAPLSGQVLWDVVEPDHGCREDQRRAVAKRLRSLCTRGTP